MHGVKKYQEILEAWDWDTGFPTGVPVERDKAHREGTPHESVHLWILRNNENEREILFQHRAAHKLIYPDCLDITVAGHVPYGFGGNKILKEADEEIGFAAEAAALIDLGWYRYEEMNERLSQREFQHVFIIRDERSLDRYLFKDREVAGIYAVSLSDMKNILTHDASINVHGFNGSCSVGKNVSRKDFHPQLFDRSMKVYMDVILQAASELFDKGEVATTLPNL
jgi:isopentenyldiphosphate isomerase